MQTTSTNQTEVSFRSENILVVPKLAFSFLNFDKKLMFLDESTIFETIERNKVFAPRSLMENDQRFLQIIPYMIYKFQDKLFLMQRSAKASETRLQSKFSLGIGGHIRKEDLCDNSSILAWGQREFLEEINFSGSFKSEFIGLLYDDSSDVGKVHLGAIFLLEGDSDSISVKTELQSGKLTSFDEITSLHSSLESWSQICFDFLQTLPSV